MQIKRSKTTSAFTLIELLVVIFIIGILIGLSVIGLQGARSSSRDARRKADLEQIRSGIEIFKADCNSYPTTLVAGASLHGSVSYSPTCLASNEYISQVPTDPISTQYYSYSSDGAIYEICASLEQQQGGASVTCGGSSACGGATCNYRVTNP